MHQKDGLRGFIPEDVFGTDPEKVNSFKERFDFALVVPEEPAANLLAWLENDSQVDLPLDDAVTELTSTLDRWANCRLEGIHHNVPLIVHSDVSELLQKQIDKAAEVLNEIGAQAISQRDLFNLLQHANEEYFRWIILHLQNRASFRTTALKNLETLGFDICNVHTNFDGEGDSHNDGQSVFKFSTDERDFYYKPRDSSTDFLLSELLDWASSEGVVVPNVPETYSINGHHVQEAIVCAPLEKSRAGLLHIGQQLGALTYLTWISGIGDINSENVLISGSTVYFIDTEATNCTITSDFSHYEKAKTLTASYSLLSQLILPRFERYFDGVFDFSYLGDLLNQTAYIGRERQQVLLHGFLRGLESASESVLSNADHLFGLIQVACKKRPPLFRVVPRPTCDYGAVLAALRDPLISFNYDLRCALLSVIESSAAEQPRLQPLISSELFALQRNDVPAFYRDHHSSAIFDHQGEISAKYFSGSVLNELQNRISSAQDVLSFQKAVCLNSFSVLGYFLEDCLPEQDNSEAIVKNTTSGEAISSAIFNLMDRIWQERISVDGFPFWISPTALSADKFALGPTSLDLYEGASGIAVVFHDVGRVLKAASFHDIAERINAGILRYWEDGGDSGPGFLNGESGILFSLAMTNADFSENDQLIRHVQSREIGRQLSGTNYDFGQGVAGTLHSFLHQNRVFGGHLSGQCRDASNLLCDHFDENGEFLNPNFSDASLGGFAHGDAGISYVLSRAYRELDEPRFLNIAISLAEREYLRISNGVYRDGRDDQNAENLSSWCFGLNGLILMCQSILSSGRESQHVVELKEFCHQNLGSSSDLDGDLCMCHGTASHVFSGKSVKEAELFRLVKDNKSFFNGTNASAPGLFTGVAGLVRASTNAENMNPIFPVR